MNGLNQRINVVCVAMCSLVMSLYSRDIITILNGSKLTSLTCSKAPGFWMVEHQLVSFIHSTNSAVLSDKLL